MAIDVVENELDQTESAFKQRLRTVGRRVKNIDLRGRIVANPFAAVGIAAGVGVLAGLARPMPQRSRIGGALMGVLTAIGFRAVRGYAMSQLGTMAKNVILNKEAQASTGAAREGVGTGVRYTPAH
jgi:hypothetical protein